jgi:hypothetical protein
LRWFSLLAISHPVLFGDWIVLSTHHSLKPALCATCWISIADVDIDDPCGMARLSVDGLPLSPAERLAETLIKIAGILLRWPMA